MDDKNYYQLFQELSPSSNVASKDVVEIEGTAHVLSKSKEGYPMFFIITEDSSSKIQNIKREILSVEYNVPCTLIDETGIEKDGYYAMITLTSKQIELHESFIKLFALVLIKYHQNPRIKDIAYEVDRLIAIFEALSRPPKKKIQGLWGELLVICQSKNPEAMIQAWHSQPDAKYDFSIGADKIEVKTTSTEQRNHRFSINQLNPSEHSRLLIASVIVRESAESKTGLSIFDIYDMICKKMESSELRLRLYAIILETLGQDMIKADKLYFDFTEASDSLAYFDYTDVPSISKESINPLVSGVKFYSNLTGLTDIRSKEEFPLDSELFVHI